MGKGLASTGTSACTALVAGSILVRSRPVLLATHTAVGVMSTPAGPLGTGTRATTRLVRGSIRTTTLSSLERIPPIMRGS